MTDKLSQAMAILRELVDGEPILSVIAKARAFLSTAQPDSANRVDADDELYRRSGNRPYMDDPEARAKFRSLFEDVRTGKLFTIHDEPGEHDPCYVVCPDGSMLELKHHATNGVDQARAQWIADACNAALAAPAAQPPHAEEAGLKKRVEVLEDAVEHALNTLVCSCAPLGNPDVDDASEIKHTIQVLQAARLAPFFARISAASKAGLDLSQFDGHTPGPWEYSAGGGHAYNSIQGTESVQVSGWVGERGGVRNGSYTTRVCENLGDIALPGPAANARLIAAASLLLAELRRVRERE